MVMMIIKGVRRFLLEKQSSRGGGVCGGRGGGRNVVLNLKGSPLLQDLHGGGLPINLAQHNVLGVGTRVWEAVLVHDPVSPAPPWGPALVEHQRLPQPHELLWVGQASYFAV